MCFDRIKESYKALRSNEHRSELEEYVFGLLDSLCKLIDCLECFEAGHRDFDAWYDLDELAKHLENTLDDTKFLRGFQSGDH